MHSLPATVLLSVVLAFGVSLSTAYALAYPGCAPISFTCLFGGACLLMCGRAPAEFPEVFVLGLLFGVLPGALGFAYVRHTLRRRGPRSLLCSPVGRLIAPGAFALIGVGIARFAFLASPLSMTAYLAGLSLPMSISFGAVAMDWEWAVGLYRPPTQGPGP